MQSNSASFIFCFLSRTQFLVELEPNSISVACTVMFGYGLEKYSLLIALPQGVEFFDEKLNTLCMAWLIDHGKTPPPYTTFQCICPLCA